MSPKLALRLGQAADSLEERIKLAIDGAQKLAANDKKYDQLIFDVQLKAKDDDIADLTKALQHAQQPPPFYERPIFVAGATTLTLILLFFASVKTVELAKPKN